MKLNCKKLLAVLLSVMMLAVLLVPAMATEGGDTGKGTAVQITKTLKIGQGITVPDETFQFVFTPVTTEEATALNEEGSYIVPGATQTGTGVYPEISPLSIAYTSASRTADGTDEELTFVSSVKDLSDSAITWDAPGLYIYSVKETAGSTAGMTYADTVYFLKVYVKNVGTGTGSGTTVDSVAVYGQDANGNWVKIDGAPNQDANGIDAKEPGTSSKDDGCDDFAGNEFKYVNTYKKVTEVHPTNPNSTSGDDTNEEFNDYAFKLTKDVVGNYANQSYGFDFKVTVHLPDTYNDFTPITAKVNGYSANLINGNTNYGDTDLGTATIQPDTECIIYLRHGDSFSIEKLPAGSTVEVKEEASNMKYIPTYSGKWGGDLTVERTGSGSKGSELQSDTIVVGEKGAYIQFTNTLNDSDVTATGIVISNLPYILMVVIALAGIGFYMVSRKRQAR